jgi:hypothetical protein
MRNKLTAILAMTVGILASSLSLFAHHSDTWADHTRLVTVTGTVIRHDFVNPHQVILLAVKDNKGKITEWKVLGSNLGDLRQAGWTKDTLKAGEQVTVSGFASRDGRPFMSRVRMVRANGEELPLTGHINVTLKTFLEVHGKEMPPAEYKALKAFFDKYYNPSEAGGGAR